MRRAGAIPAWWLLGALLVAGGAEAEEPSPEIREGACAVESAAPDGAAPRTLEDINGPTGNNFQAAIGFVNFESTSTMNPATPGYGLALDDMVVTWAEVQKVTDTTDCAVAGACATIDLQSTNIFESSSLVAITVIDSSPYGDPAVGPLVDCNVTPANAVCVNDCNDDGDLTDVGIDDNDCNDDFVRDVIVRATSEGEPAGELVALNETATQGVFRGELPISAAYDSPGVLFLLRQGTDLPTVTVTYEDHEDGTGDICRNDIDPAAQGRVRASTSVFFETGALTVVNAVLTEVGTNGVNHDGDGFADAGETVDMQLTLRNGGELPENNVVARLATNDPRIECILQTFISVGTLPSRVNTLTSEAFRFKVADSANRVNVNDLFAASFSVTFSSDRFAALAAPQPVTIDLDLDAGGGSGPTSFVENFDSGTFGAFTNDNIDFGLHSLAASDGYRCQYSDPDWVNSNSYGSISDCFLGANPTHADAVWWHVESGATPAGTRGYTGGNSLHYGVDLAASMGFTTPLRTLDAVQTTNPVNLGTLANPELTFKHQISLVDNRTVSAGFGRTGDKGVVMLQLADAGGGPVGDWIKLQPYINPYDTQPNDNFTNCHFDPIDDGSDEGDFFDPTDPDRRLGPSSVCFPEFVYVYQGNTQEPFGVNDIARATEGPGLQGATGVGTWVEARYDLSRFRGRRVRLRYLTSAYWGQSDETHQERWNVNTAGPDPRDDGWWLDEVRVTNTLTSAATISVDTDTVTPLPCGATCNTVTASLALDPPGGMLPAPGQVVELDASASVADRCLNGTLQYRFWIDGNGSGSADPGDTLLRGYTDNPVLLDAPTSSTRYVVEVRCSTATTCNDTASGVATVALSQSGSFFWTVNAGSQSLTVIDVVSEQAVDSVPLAAADDPNDIAFSTIDGLAGDYAFVTQGSSLRVVNTSKRTVVRTVDVHSLFDALPEHGPADSVVLRGIDSARLQRFTVDGLATVKAFLHVAADVDLSGAPPSGAWFIVFDQETLIPPATPAIVQAGSLFFGAEALDVTVQASPEGPEFQRVWFTTRSGDTLRVFRVASPREILTPAWQIEETVTRTAGLPIPDGLLLGSPYCRPPAILPEGPLGTLRDLYTGQQVCSFGGNQRAVAVVGTGWQSYLYLALDSTGGAAPGTGQVRFADVTQPACVGPSRDVGTDPVDIDTVGEVVSRRVLVTNRGSNDVTIIRPDLTTGTIPLTLGLGPGGTGPTAGKTQETPATSCSIENVNYTTGQVTWSAVGCETSTPFIIWCQCIDGLNCPVECDGCDAGNTTGIPFDAECPLIRTAGETPWEPLGDAPKGSNTYVDGLGAASVNYNVTFDDREPGL